MYRYIFTVALADVEKLALHGILITVAQLLTSWPETSDLGTSYSCGLNK